MLWFTDNWCQYFGIKLLPHLRAVSGLKKRKRIAFKTTHSTLTQGFTSVSQVYYLFRARNNESSGWLFGLMWLAHHVKDKSSTAVTAVHSARKHPGKDWKTPVGHSARDCSCCQSTLKIQHTCFHLSFIHQEFMVLQTITIYRGD